MAKSGKHKKIRRQEKAKLQLKRAQNVIEPKLQTKKIVIREQLKAAPDSEVTTRRKQTFQDIIASLNHHNVNAKVEALQSLQELIFTDDQLLDLHLGKIVEKISGLTSDSESEVRRENMKVAAVLFSEVTESQLIPFWSLIVTRLRCSLTDLNPAVRQGCLPFISLLMTSYPELVARSKSTIIPTLLKLISTSSTGKSSTANVVHVKTDLADRSTDVIQRCGILEMVTDCLYLSNFDDVEEPMSKEVEWSPDVVDMDADSESEVIYPVGYCDVVHGGPDVIAATDSSLENFVHEQNVKEVFALQFIQSCLPILVETWVEVAPSNAPLKQSLAIAKGKKRQSELMENNRGSNSISKVAVQVLDCITNLLTKTISYCDIVFGDNNNSNSSETSEPSRKQRRSLSKSENISNPLLRKLNQSSGPDLQKYFFNVLPFSCAQENLQSAMTGINLRIFAIAAALNLMDNNVIEKFKNYLESLMRSEVTEPDHVTLALAVIKYIPDHAETAELASKLLCSVIESTRLEPAVYDYLQDLLELDPHPNKLVNSLNWEPLCNELVTMFLKNFNEDLLNILTLLAIRNLGGIQELVQQQSSTFSDLRASGITVYQQHLLNRLLFYCAVVEEDELD